MYKKQLVCCARLLATWTGGCLALAGVVATSNAADPPSDKPIAPPASIQSAQSSPLLQSDANRAMLQEFDQWASVQKSYDPARVTELRGALIEKMSRLSGRELDEFLASLRDKLSVLMSAEARDARKWLDQTLAVASDSYAQQVKAKLPDVATMTASQIQEKLDEFEDERQTKKQYSQSFADTRKLQVQAVQAAARRQAEANASARSAGAGSSSGYNPGGGRTQRSFERYGSAYPILYGARFW